MDCDADIIEISSDSESTVSRNLNDGNLEFGNDISFPNPCSYDINHEWYDDEEHPAIDYDAPITTDEMDADINNKASSNGNESGDTIIYDHHKSDGGGDDDDDDDDDEDAMQDFSQSTENSLSSQQGNGKVKRQKICKEERELRKEKAQALKEEKRLERERIKFEKKAEQLKQKALKAAVAENQRNIKPDESIKLLKVHIDNEIINSIFGGNVITVLQQAEVQYAVETQVYPFTLSWSKRIKESYMNDAGQLQEHIQVKAQDQLLYIVTWKKMIELVHEKELLSHIQTVRSVCHQNGLTVVIFGIEKYYNYQKVKKNRDLKSAAAEGKRPKPKQCEIEFEEAADVSRDELMFALTELQVLGKCNHRLVETPEELAAVVLNFTKSIAQLDFKLQKNKNEENLDWFAKADSKQSVKVDKNGNGLLKLWQQQLCQFNLVGIEVAQAIVSHYNSPQSLMTEYRKCSSVVEGELLLQNIPVRRNAGILSSSRRIGAELSKKLYHFFTSDNPNLEL